MSTQNRKKFLDIILGAGATAWLLSVLYPVGRYLIPPKIADPNISSVDIGPEIEFKRDSSKIIRFGRKPVIVVRMKNGNFKAFSATCTHLDCTVQFKNDTQQIWCACHNGLYDLEGRNISGPPPRPLTKYGVRTIQGNVVVEAEDMA